MRQGPNVCPRSYRITNSRYTRADMSIIQNKKAFHDYFVEERFEAGLALEGSALTSASTHVNADPVRTRKLLMHAEEIGKLIGKVERAGYALVPLDLHYTRGRIKLSVGLAKGKKQHDKRQVERQKEWQREQQRILKQKV